MPDDNDKLVISCDNSAEDRMEMNGEIWMTTNEHSLVGSRVPFTKKEKEFLCSLIQKHVYSKLSGPRSGGSDLMFGGRSPISAFCRVPNTAWKTIFDEYNALETVRKRSIKQLRKCWENLKHRGKINPEALYSGKRLHGRTSMSGAFTLTTEEEETAEEKLSPPTPIQDDVTHDNSPLDGVDLTLNNSSHSNRAESVSTRNVFSSVAASSQNRSETFTKFGETDDVVENTSAREVNKENSTLRGADTQLPFVTSQLLGSSSRPTMVTPRITNVRTVRSLKPMANQIGRRFPSSFSRLNGSRNLSLSSHSVMAKTHAQKIHEMKVKLIAARIKEHEANVEKVNLQMRQAQAHHDVTMRLLRTKAAWYDAHLRQMDRQLRSGDLSMVGEEDDDYRGDIFIEDGVRYEEGYE